MPNTIPTILASWWLQSHMVMDILKEHNLTAEAHNLQQTLGILDNIWRSEFDGDYEDEVIRLIQLMQQSQPHETSSREENGSNVIPLSSNHGEKS